MPQLRKVKYVESFLARENFEENNAIDLREFRKGPIQKVYFACCGITSVRDLSCINYASKLACMKYVKHNDVDPLKDVDLSDAFEIIEYCLYEGKVDLESDFETNLYKSLITQINEIQDSFVNYMYST